MKPSVLLSAAPLLLAAMNPAQAQSAATASLSFSVIAGNGFSWLDDPLSPSSSVSEATAAGFQAWVADGIGGWVPQYATPSDAGQTESGVALPQTQALSFSGSTFSSASVLPQAGNRAATLQAAGIAPVAGYTAAGASARSYFTLQPGSSVTFLGALNLGVSGLQPTLPSAYITTELFGYATGLLSAGGLTDGREIGNAALAYTPGNYSFGETALLSVTVSNDSNAVYTGYLDSAVGIYAVSAVPEPSTYALLLAGVLVVGFVARRRA